MPRTDLRPLAELFRAKVLSRMKKVTYSGQELSTGAVSWLVFQPDAHLWHHRGAGDWGDIGALASVAGYSPTPIPATWPEPSAPQNVGHHRHEHADDDWPGYEEPFITSD